MKNIFSSRTGIIIVGAIIGIGAALLQYLGNPGNMGICVACFERDIAGALGLHRAGIVQYLRPEIMGFVLGAFAAALFAGEYKPRGGSAPLVRFFLGMFAMIGALVFLGCPWRMLLRLAGGDGNAILGILGLVFGIFIGVQFLKRGFTLGRSYTQAKATGWIMPGFMLALFLLLVFNVQFAEGGPIFSSVEGPGSKHAPIFVSIIAGLIIGTLAQRSRFCTMGAFRDAMMTKDFHLISGVGALLLFAFLANLIFGQFNAGFEGQPIAHTN
ncbi:MAG: YedE family putative selenium transporter, partial [Smithellaceae bacterium]|nr:YedE family putative selenium transporter [Smithellaceae bacterium]